MDPSLSVQRQVKENVDEINDFIKGLKIWEDEMKQKEQKLKDSESDKEVIPPIRTKSSLYECRLNENIKKANAEEEEEEEEKRMELDEKCKLRERSLYEKELGNTAVKENNWDKAIFHYTEAISCFENDATYYANRAFCFLKQKRFREAETDCTSALQLDETYVKALHRRALCRIELNQLAEAYADLLKAQQLEPENTTVKNEISKLKKQLMKTGQLDILNQFSDEKSKTELKHEAAYLEKDKGNQCVNKKQWSQAIEHYTNAIKLHESDVFYANRALCYLKLDMPESALLDAKFASELNQSNVKAFHRQYMAFNALGQFVEAKNCLLKCLELDADNPTIINELKCLEEKIIASQTTSTPSMDVDADVKNVMLQTDESNNNNDIIDRYGTKRAVSNKLCGEEKQIKKCRFDDDDGPFKEELISWERLNEIRVIKLQKWILKRIRKKCGKPLEEEMPIMSSQSDYKKPSENYKKQQPIPTEEKRVEPSKPSFGFVFNFQSSKENEKFTSLKDSYVQAGFIPVESSSTSLEKQTEKAKFVNVKWNELKTAKEDVYLNSLTDYVNKTTDDTSATNTDGSDLKAALLKLDQYAEQCIKESSQTFNNQSYNEKVNVVTTKEESVPQKNGSQTGNVADGADLEVPSSSVPQFAIPKTYLQFTETMRIFQNNTYQQYLYVKKVHPNRFPQLFKDSLEENTLCQIINLLEQEFLKRSEDSVFEYLLNISKVNRFNTIILFALKDINKQLENLFRQCEITKKNGSDEVARLKKLYLI